MAYKGGAKVQKVMGPTHRKCNLLFVFFTCKKYKVAGRAIKGGKGSVEEKRKLFPLQSNILQGACFMWLAYSFGRTLSLLKDTRDG